MLRSTLLTLCLTLLATTGTAAHEFWLEPSSSAVAAGSSVSFRLFVGAGFPGEPYARNPAHLRRFELVGPSRSRAIRGRPGGDPAGSILAEEPGLHIAVYRSGSTPIALGAREFEDYLAEEGLQHISNLRAERGESGKDGREAYSRCAKTLVTVGPATPGDHDRVVGLDLELVPRNDPRFLRPGEALEVQALHRGEPHGGLMLHVFARGRREPVARIRTDALGRASVAIDEPGRWMVSTVHMQPSASKDVDWSSTWSSLTFDVPASGADDR